MRTSSTISFYLRITKFWNRIHSMIELILWSHSKQMICANVWIENIVCVPSIPKPLLWWERAHLILDFEESICHGNNLAFMYTREFAHFYSRSRPLFHARFDAGSAIFLPPSMVRSRNYTRHNLIPYVCELWSVLKFLSLTSSIESSLLNVWKSFFRIMYCSYILFQHFWSDV